MTRSVQPKTYDFVEAVIVIDGLYLVQYLTTHLPVVLSVSGLRDEVHELFGHTDRLDS